MKKVFLAVLCAGLFFACGNKKQAEQPETLVDTPVVEQTVAEITEEAEPVAEEPVAEAAPAKKTATPAKKTATPAKKTTNNNNSGMTAGKTNEAPSVEDHAKSAANKVANTAIDKAEKETTNAIVNSGKKKR